MKHRRATATDPEVVEPEEAAEPTGIFDNPFHIRGEEQPAAPAAPSAPVASPQVAAPQVASPTIDLTAETPSVAPTAAPHVAPPPTPPTAGEAGAEVAEPAPGQVVVDASITEADQREALDLTAVAPHTRSRRAAGAPAGFLSASPPRLRLESVLVRLIATAGVVAIGTAVGAALVANDVEGWIVGLAVSLVSVALAAVLWRSRGL